jgi:hypothetical protein
MRLELQVTDTLILHLLWSSCIDLNGTIAEYFSSLRLVSLHSARGVDTMWSLCVSLENVGVVVMSLLLCIPR